MTSTSPKSKDIIALPDDLIMRDAEADTEAVSSLIRIATNETSGRREMM